MDHVGDDEHELITAAAVREVIYARQLGVCPACGYGLHPEQMHAHHRLRRKDLGWCPCNVIGLHPSCHVIAPEAVHQRPQWAVERGLIVRTWDDPRDVPVHFANAYPALVYLRCDGSASQLRREGHHEDQR